MRIILAIFSAVTLAISVSGCGGGGGTSTPSAQLAQAELNSVYTYDISASSGRADSVTGRLTLTIVRDGDILSKRGMIDLDDGGNSFSSEIAALFTQDASGSVFYAGKSNPRDGRTTLSESRPLSVRSPLRTGDSWNSSAVSQVGARETWRSVVGALESVAAGGLLLSAYRIETTRTNQYGSSVISTWYSPEHPVPVKAVGRIDGWQVVIVLSQLDRNSADFDSPPAPPMSDGGNAAGTEIDFDTPPAPPVQWVQRGQDVAAIICEMLN